jgi:hypothetical protein
MILRLALAVALTVSVFSLDTSAQRRGRGGYSGITVYEHPDFRGESVTFRGEIPDLRQLGLNDHISSLEVDGNQAWEVCRDVFFNGGCRVFTGSIDDLRQEGWNDRISSLRPAGFASGGWGNGRGNSGNNRNSGVDRNRRAQPRLVLYERTNYGGDSRDVLNTSGILRSGDRFRSVQVEGGTWELCEGTSRNDRCVTVSRDVPDLRSLGLRNGVTAVREVRQNNTRWF